MTDRQTDRQTYVSVVVVVAAAVVVHIDDVQFLPLHLHTRYEYQRTSCASVKKQ